jgi:hypothetical protein
MASLEPHLGHQTRDGDAAAEIGSADRRIRARIQAASASISELRRRTTVVASVRVAASFESAPGQNWRPPDCSDPLRLAQLENTTAPTLLASDFYSPNSSRRLIMLTFGADYESEGQRFESFWARPKGFELVHERRGCWRRQARSDPHFQWMSVSVVAGPRNQISRPLHRTPLPPEAGFARSTQNTTITPKAPRRPMSAAPIFGNLA